MLQRVNNSLARGLLGGLLGKSLELPENGPVQLNSSWREVKWLCVSLGFALLCPALCLLSRPSHLAAACHTQSCDGHTPYLDSVPKLQLNVPCSI